VRLQFREKAWDLYVAIGYVAVISAVLLFSGVGNFLAVLLVLFVPGYVFVAAIFPADGEIDWIERIALAFGLSIAVVPLLGLLLNFTPWGIRLVPVLFTITIFAAGVGYAAYWRRMRLPSAQRLAFTVNIALPNWKHDSGLEKGLTAAVAASIAIAGTTFAYVLLTPRPLETFTEFYILGPSGNVSGYPTRLNVSQDGTVILGIANHESASINYTLRIDVAGVQLVYNATSGFNETIEVNRTTWSTFKVTVADRQDWTRPYTFRINYTGLWKVQFLLFKDSGFAESYRELHLYVAVS